MSDLDDGLRARRKAGGFFAAPAAAVAVVAVAEAVEVAVVVDALSIPKISSRMAPLAFAVNTSLARGGGGGEDEREAGVGAA